MALIGTRFGRSILTLAFVLVCVVAAPLLAAAAASATPPAVSGLMSTTHPDQAVWYANSDPLLRWDALAAAAGYSWVLDHSATTVPDATTERYSFGFTRVDASTGSHPWAVAAGDFNTDGKLDIVTPDWGSYTVSVSLGNGDGTFQDPVAQGTGSSPHSLAVGDFNEDGKLDVAVTNRYSAPVATVSVLLGNGNGTLRTKVDYAVGGVPKQVASADFDSDGHLDLAVAENTGGAASVLLGNGDGTFDPKQEYAAGAGSEAIATGDFNGDHVVDIAVGNWDGNSVSILVGNGNGTFKAGVDYAAGSQPHDVEVGDWNGDGRLDLAVADYTGNTVSVLLGAGDGTFAARTSYIVGSVVSSVEHADINGDGYADLAVADFGLDTVHVMLGKGDGTFAVTTDFAVGDRPNSVVVADFDKDGADDFVAANSQGDDVLGTDPPSTVSVLKNTRLSTPPSTSYTSLGEGVWYFHVRAVDAAGVGGLTVHLALRVDLTPPVTTDDAPVGLVDHAVTVTLTPADGGSGMSGGPAGTWYKLDGAASYTSGTSVPVSGVAIHTILSYSRDAAGNAETAHSTRVTIAPATAPTEVYVDTAWAGTTVGTDPDAGGPAFAFGYDGFSTIADGVADVAAGGTVHVLPGSYFANLVIGRHVRVVSTGGALVTTLQPLFPAADLVTIAADGVTFRGFTAKGSLLTDIRINAVTGASVTQNRVLNGAASTPTNGIWNEGGSSNAIADNVVDVTGTGPAIGSHDGSALSITGNIVQHGGAYGIRVFGGTGSSVGDNTVGGVTAGKGIGLLSTGTTSVTGNTVSGNGAGIFVNNTTGSTLTGNTVTTNTGAGIWVDVGGAAPTVTGNAISGNGSGLVNDGSGTVDALHNWWGAASGPYDAKTLPGTPNYSNPSGTGDSVDDYVNYDRWYTDAAMTALSSGYTLGVTLDGSGSVAKSPDQTGYDWGQSVQLTATPAADWTFVGWSGDAGGMTNPVSLTIGGDKAVTAKFSPAAGVTITVTAGAHGSITPGTGAVASGSSPTYAITPDTGYHIASLTVDGISKTPQGTWTFTNVTATHTIAATFAIDTFAITVTAGAHGSVTPGTGSVAYGSSPTYTIAPDAGYHIESLTVDGTPRTVQGTWTFTDVTAAHTIAATFAIDTFTMTVTAGAHGSVTPGTGSVAYGSSPTYAITPDAGYHIASLTVDGTPRTVQGTWTFTDVTAAHTIAATFAIDTFAITVTSGAHGAITPGTGAVAYGTSPTYAITPDAGYHIASLIVDGTPQAAQGSWTFTNVAAIHTIAATFAINTFTITPSVVGGAAGHGAVTPATPQSADDGATPTFTFAPEAGYHVDEVRVDGALVSMTGANQYTFPAVHADHGISVKFAIGTFTITVTAGAHGSVTPGTGSVASGSSPTYAITPDAGYHVASLTVDGTPKTVQDSWTFASVQAAHSIAATFAIDTFAITVTSGAYGAITPGSGAVASGTSPTYAITPDAGYHVASLTVDGTPKTVQDSWTFANVQAAHSIAATFAIDTFAITVTSGAHGAITPGTGAVAYGTSPTYAITPDAGYHVASLTVDGTPQAAQGSWTFTNVTAPHSIAATFVADPVPVLEVVVSSPNGGERWTVGSTYPVGWTVTSGVTAGSFRVYAVNGAVEQQLTTTAVPATGATSYSVPWKVGVTPATTWMVSVRYLDAGGSEATRGDSAAPFTISAAPVLGKPTCPASIRKGRTFTVKGLAKPGAPTGPAVKIRAYRQRASSWVVYKTYSARVAGTEYSAKLKIAVTGKFKFKAASSTTTSSFSKILTIKP